MSAYAYSGGQIGVDDVKGTMSSSSRNVNGNVNGNGSGNNGSATEWGTLDEPVSVTILRDVKRVGVKIRHVLLPMGSVKELRDWDLWGPLLLCLVLATSLAVTAPNDQSALVFAAVFVIVWVGAGVVTINAALLDGKISFLQSVCVLGYCIAPLCVASILCHIFTYRPLQGAIVAIAFFWATKASVGFMAQLVQENRRALSVYPVVLFYTAIAWMILLE